jgi:hypothetical protein
MGVPQAQRFCKDRLCPICGGHDEAPRGRGARCYGFLSDDGRFAHCTRDEHAGRLSKHPNSDTYAHQLIGDCHCGVRHDPSPPGSSSNGTGHRQRILATYNYTDAQEALLYQVIRYANPKAFKQRRPDGKGGWIWSLQGVRRVLYRLPEVTEAVKTGTIIFKPEGEQDVETLRALGLVATTNSEGAGKGKWRGHLAEDLRGARLVVLPDNDNDGHRHAVEVINSVLPVVEWVKRLDLPGLPEKGDVSDWCKAGHTKEELLALVEEASIIEVPSTSTEMDGKGEQQPEEWADPLPFDMPRTLPPFPVEVLPKDTRAYVEEVAATRQVPVDLPGMLSLGVVSGAAARRFRVQIGTTHSEPLNTFVAAGMEPGSRKSVTYQDMVEPLEAYERDLKAQMAPKIAEAQEKRLIEESRLRFLRERAAKAEDSAQREKYRKEALELASQLTVIPAEPRLVAGDVTSEKLANLLFEQDGRMVVMDAEAGGIFEIMAGRYTRDGGLNLDVYLRGHAGDTLRVDRVGRPAEYVYNPALTMILTPQPEVIRALADRPGFRGRGLLGRFLYAIPDSLVGQRTYQDRCIDPKTRQTYTAVVQAILEWPDAKARDGKGTHHVLSLTGEALEAWAEYADAVEAAQADGGELAGIRDWASKLAGAVARIAGGLHLVKHYRHDEPWTVPISPDTVLAAWAIGEYLKAHALAAYAMMGAHPNVSMAQRLLRWIERHQQKEFSLRDCHQHHRNVAKPDDLLPALEILEGRGFIRRLPPPEPTGPGRRPSPTFEVNPKLTSSTHNAQNSQN